MIVERTEHPSWLSNAYLVADEPGGHGVLVDGNGITSTLLDRVERDEITLTHILLTHHHDDHVVDIAELSQRYGVPVTAHARAASELGDLVTDTVGDGAAIRSGELVIQAIETPGHAPGHLALLADGVECFTGDVLFRRTVGGTRTPGGSYADLRDSILERLLRLPPETRVHPGHADPTTIGEEWQENPFVRVWRGLDAEGSDRCRVDGKDATLVLWAVDYDGGHKAWVRLENGENAIVGGSRVERLEAPSPPFPSPRR